MSCQTISCWTAIFPNIFVYSRAVWAISKTMKQQQWSRTLYDWTIFLTLKERTSWAEGFLSLSPELINLEIVGGGKGWQTNNGVVTNDKIDELALNAPTPTSFLYSVEKRKMTLLTSKAEIKDGIYQLLSEPRKYYWLCPSC